MGLLKDWLKDNEGYVFRVKVKYFFSPSVWFRLHKYRKQRADRGWSDRDTWGAGDHIAQMTAEMLQHLNDSKYTDWPEWFKLNVQETDDDAYTNLQDVIDDIKAYLDFEWTSWAEGLETKRDSVDDWYDGDKKLSEEEIKERIDKWHTEFDIKYKKAQKAMSFFARHFSGFWY